MSLILESLALAVSAQRLLVIASKAGKLTGSKVERYKVLI